MNAPPRQTPTLSDRDRRWREWWESKLGGRRPYVAIKSAESPEDLEIPLTLTHNGRTLPEPDPEAGAVVLVALDGAPEYSRACAEAHNYNGALGEVEEKDEVFYRRAARALLDHGGVLVQQGHARSDTPTPDQRLFQDACPAIFPESDLLALAAALHVHRQLAAYNECTGLDWRGQLHARVVVARSWAKAIPCVPTAWRGQTVVEGEVWDALEVELRYVMSAAGVRRGGPVKFPKRPTDAAQTERVLAKNG